ncbi:hypothetical protein ACP4OV_016471 [Aristida adscensionis]
MWRRGGDDGGRVVAVDGEVHVQRVESIGELVKNGGAPATATRGGVAPAPPAAVAVVRGGGKAARDVNELAEEFIRRTRDRLAFQGMSGQKPINV